MYELLIKAVAAAEGATAIGVLVFTALAAPKLDDDASVKCKLGLQPNILRKSLRRPRASQAAKFNMNERLELGSEQGALNGRFWVLARKGRGCVRQ